MLGLNALTISEYCQILGTNRRKGFHAGVSVLYRRGMVMIIKIEAQGSNMLILELSHKRESRDARNM